MRGLTRRHLLATAAAAGVAAGCGSSSKPAALDPRDWASVKAQFPLTEGVRHFDAFVLATHPGPVREAIERHRRGLDADPAGYLHAHEAELDRRVLDAAARYLDVPPSFAFTDSTTMGLGLVYGGIRVDGRPVATEHDFYSTHESLRLRFGDFRRVRLYGDPSQATVSGMVEAARAGVSEGTGVLALTWVHSGTGVKVPVQQITELRPFIPTFHPSRTGRQATDWNPGGFHTFEHRWALAEAFDVHHRIGRTNVTKRSQSLATRLKEGLADLRTVWLVTPMAEEVSAGIVCFDVDGLDPRSAVEQLRREHGVAAGVTPYAQPYVRLGTGLWVDETDVDAALDAIARL